MKPNEQRCDHEKQRQPGKTAAKREAPTTVASTVAAASMCHDTFASQLCAACQSKQVLHMPLCREDFL
jgi:hypothetical protein